MRVLVPFGRRTISAYLLGFGAAPEGQQLKSVLELLDEEPLWTDRQLVFSAGLPTTICIRWVKS